FEVIRPVIRRAGRRAGEQVVQEAHLQDPSRTTSCKVDTAAGADHAITHIGIARHTNANIGESEAVDAFRNEDIPTGGCDRGLATHSLARSVARKAVNRWVSNATQLDTRPNGADEGNTLRKRWRRRYRRADRVHTRDAQT